MPNLLNDRQIQILIHTLKRAPEPATAQALREFAELRQLGLLSFDASGRYEMTPHGHARLRQYVPSLH